MESVRHTNIAPLGHRDVHLWVARLVATAGLVREFEAMLSPDEKQRAQAFVFERHRNAFIIGRGLLRAILGSYLQQPPDRVVLEIGAKGKPALCVRPRPLHFNLAHSGECVVFAVSRDREIGVDVELVRTLPDAEAIAARYFAPEEVADLMRVAHEHRAEAFFNCWTRKEAYVKAVGEGLSLPLDTFQVSLMPWQPAAFLSLHCDKVAVTDWTLLHLTPFEGYVGALAAPWRDCAVLEYTFPNAEACLRYASATQRVRSFMHSSQGREAENRSPGR